MHLTLLLCGMKSKVRTIQNLSWMFYDADQCNNSNGGGGLIVPALFSDSYFYMKKRFGGLRFRDFSQFIMNFQKIKKQLGFSQYFGVI